MSNAAIIDSFLDSLDYEKSQDIELVESLLKQIPLKGLSRLGLAISNLTVTNSRTGLAGKLVIELAQTQSTPVSSDLKNGDIVIIKPYSKKEDNDQQCQGVVVKISNAESNSTSPTSLAIAIDESQENIATTMIHSNEKFYVLKTVNTVTYDRMNSTLRKLKEFKEKSISNPIIDILLPTEGVKKLRASIPNAKKSNIQFFDENLNDSQKYAIRFSMENKLSIIHGPPGTGKTYTVVELIRQLISKDSTSRVLVCAPSNIAVDTILERLSKSIKDKRWLLRIGHPARLLKTNWYHSLDILSKEGTDSASIINDISMEITKTIASIKSIKSSGERRKAWAEVKQLRKELRLRERKVINDLIKQSRVVVATLHGSSSRELCNYYKSIEEGENDNLFDYVIIDEVSQSLEPQCWIPLISHLQSKITKLVLAGDSKQLPPTIKTNNNDKVMKVLGTTLFDRLVNMYGDEFKNLLNIQYRMNAKIMEFSSKAMYNGELKADSSVENIVLSDLPGVDSNEETDEPIIWYDTQGDDFPEVDEEEDELKSKSAKFLYSSKLNTNEAYLVLHHVRKLIESNVQQDCIGIISPYNAQVSLLKKLVNGTEDSPVYPLIEISSVDGFQGREKECIILSLVRSNDKAEVGFLKEQRRLNVAMTRPKRQLCVIGNIETLQRSGNSFLKDWTEWSEDNADLRYPDVGEIYE